MTPLRIAILAHSTNPRGGVVHALELGDALTRLGHEAVVHAPDAIGAGFFRPTLCATVCVPASPVKASTRDMVATRIDDYIRHFQQDSNRRFDVFHAQDGISANALASLKARSVIQHFARTLHHVDHFDDAEIMALQARAIADADSLFVVSQTWQDYLRREYGRSSRIIGNGVDILRCSPHPDGREAALRHRLGLGEGPVFLAIGGVEARKNTLGILRGFAQVRHVHQAAQLVIAGGASVLDHQAYCAEFARELAAFGLPEAIVNITGPLLQADMPALYRIADALVFPSLKEGFGLVVLEAMASGIPVVTSRIAPFTQYLGAQDVARCNPLQTASIAAAMRASLQPEMRRRLAANGHAVAARHDWQRTATAHLKAYAQIREPHHA